MFIVAIRYADASHLPRVSIDKFKDYGELDKHLLNLSERNLSVFGVDILDKVTEVKPKFDNTVYLRNITDEELLRHCRHFSSPEIKELCKRLENRIDFTED